MNPFFTDELQKLSDEGLGRLVSREEMIKDRFLSGNDRATVFMKPAPMYITAAFLRMANDRDCTDTFYAAQFHKEVDDKMKKMVNKYHPHLQDIMISQASDCGMLREICSLKFLQHVATFPNTTLNLLFILAEQVTSTYGSTGGQFTQLNPNKLSALFSSKKSAEPQTDKVSSTSDDCGRKSEEHANDTSSPKNSSALAKSKVGNNKELKSKLKNSRQKGL